MNKFIYIITLIVISKTTFSMNNKYPMAINSFYEERIKIIHPYLKILQLYPDIKLTEDEKIIFYLYTKGYIESKNLPKQFKEKIENLGKNKKRKNMTRSISIIDVLNGD